MELSRGSREQQLTIEQQQELDRQQAERLEQQRPNVEEQVNQYTNTALAAFNPEDQQKLKQALTDTAMQHGGKRPGIEHIAFTKEGNLRLFMTNAEDRILKPADILGYQPKLHDPEQLRHIHQQLDGKLEAHLKPYSVEQSEQIKQALTQEISELTGKNLHIDRIDTINDAKLKVTYNRDQTLTFDPNEYLANRELEQKLQQPDIPEDPHLLAFSQIREQTEQQLASHLSSAELNSLQQNVLTNRISEAVQQLGGDQAHISQINPLEDGRLQIQLEGQRTELRISPQALLAEQGLFDKPVAEGLAGIQSYRPGLDGPIDYTVQQGDNLSKIGEKLSPEYPKAFAYYAYQHLVEQYGDKPGTGVYYDQHKNHIHIEVGQHLSVDLSNKTPEQLQQADRAFARQQTLEHSVNAERQRQAEQRAAEQKQQELAQQKAQDRQNNLFKPFTQSVSDIYGQDGLGRSSAGNRFDALYSQHGVGSVLSLNRGMSTQASAATSHIGASTSQTQTSNSEANWQYSQGLGKGALETGKDMLIGAATIASDTFWGAGNILTGGIFNNTDFMQGVVQRNNALYEGLYQTAGELTSKFMYYGAHPDEAVKDTARTINEYREQREVLFALGQYEEAGKRDGQLGTEAALFATPAVMGAVKLARAGKVAEVGRMLTAEKVVEAELPFERKLGRSRENISQKVDQPLLSPVERLKIEEDLITKLGTDIKNHPLRIEYEQEVNKLSRYKEMIQPDMTQTQLKELAEEAHKARRDLGVKYKDMTPEPLRDYIYEVNMKRYEDPFGPTLEYLVDRRDRTYTDIIESASRPNKDVNHLLNDYGTWLKKQDEAIIVKYKNYMKE